jgi:hypothetical protein
MGTDEHESPRAFLSHGRRIGLLRPNRSCWIFGGSVAERLGRIRVDPTPSFPGGATLRDPSHPAPAWGLFFVKQKRRRRRRRSKIAGTETSTGR